MLEEHIGRLTASSNFESAGQLEIDVAGAFKKLAYGLERDPEKVLAKLCAGLVSLEGEEIWLRNERRGFLVAVKNPQRDWWPASLADLALGKLGPGLKPLGLGALALQPHVQGMAWIRWGETCEVLPLGIGPLQPPQNPWKTGPAAGLWFEGKLPRLRLREMLYRRLAQRVYHCPVPIRWNRYTMGMDIGEASHWGSEGEYLCLQAQEDGVMGLRPRAEAGQELWGSLGWVARHWLARVPPRCPLRWVDECPQASPQSGKGTWFPELAPARSYRFYQGSLLLVFHTGTSFIVPVHHGELLDLVPVVDEEFSSMRVGIGIFAPADRLATDLVHSRLLEDEAFLAWQRRLLQRVSGVMRRISSASAEIQSVKDLRARVLWSQWCRKLTFRSDEGDWGHEVNQKDCLAGLFGLSPGGVTYHCRKLSALKNDARVVSLWIHPDRDVSPIWAELERGQLTLASTSNPLYDLVAYCQDLPDQVEAIRLVWWSEGCVLKSWSRDDAGLLDESSLPKCKNGLMLHIFEKGYSRLHAQLKFGQSDPLCPTWSWEDQNQDPALVRRAGQGLTERIAMWIFTPRPKQATTYQGFAPAPGQWGFTLALSAANHCTFQGKLQKTGSLRCGMCFSLRTVEQDRPTTLELYRFGCHVRTSFLDWGLAAETVRVDASHWDMSRARKDLLAEDGWLTILENGNF